MNVYSHLEYKRAQKEEVKLRKFISQLDIIGDLLYNNLEYDGVFEVIDKFEDLRLRYYIQHYECETIINKKGQIDV